MIKIGELSKIWTPEDDIYPSGMLEGVAEGINCLIPVLSRNAESISAGDLEYILSQSNFHLIFAMDDVWPDFTRQVVGMALIFFVQRPEGWLGQIHSVVVDKSYRGQHIGSGLLKALLAEADLMAKKLNKKIKVELTSNPNNADRATAIKMYEKYGFKMAALAVDQDGTNLYRLVVTP
ncbi:MAG: hypothetical protein G01um101419_498 [Parcubacteria group bacterium Gr01-1014_19]|nr:MAG: hypothetical protein G01um101419_498 [Parcubacteria group bacterium Gr01-1014_19]